MNEMIYDHSQEAEESESASKRLKQHDSTKRTNEELSDIQPALVNLLKEADDSRSPEISDQEMEVNTDEPRNPKKSITKILLSITGVLLVFIVLFVVLLGLPAKKTYSLAIGTYRQAQKLKASFSQKDFAIIKSELVKTEEELVKTRNQYRKFSWIRSLPIAKEYYKDGERLLVVGEKGIEIGKILVVSVEPYSDFIGFKASGEQARSAEKTTEDRIEFLVASINSLKPQIETIENDLELIQEQVSGIDADRYPENWRGQEIRPKIIEAKAKLAEFSNIFIQGKPLFEKADWLLGKDKPRRYFFIFQNNGELRPTGGFWTAYGILEVKNGKITPLVSEDIYALDSRFGKKIPAPSPIKKYHKNVNQWYLRDMNLSPDFKTSVETFMGYYEQMKGASPVDAVIAVDTDVLVDLLKVIGRIGVPGWGNFIPEPDSRCFGCPQVVYQLEMLADKPLSTMNSNRKGFLAPLMHSLFANMLGSPKDKIGSLAETIWNDMLSKHVVVYFPDAELEKSAGGLGISGAISDFDGDYFHFNDSNFGGAKSNLFITQEVKQEYTISAEGKAKKKVTISYKNSAPASDCNLERGNLCLNAMYRDWFRLYVPIGSTLQKISGSEVDVAPYDELGKTVFEGFFGNQFPLRPEGSARVVYEYELPFSANSDFELFIQKQPGTKPIKHEIWVNNIKKSEVVVNSDVVLTINP